MHFVTLAVTKLTKKWKIKNHFMKRKTNYKLPIGDQGERKKQKRFGNKLTINKVEGIKSRAR